VNLRESGLSPGTLPSTFHLPTIRSNQLLHFGGLRVSRQLDADRPNFLFARELAGTGHLGEDVDKPATWPERLR
jgi:hypothetical protein